MKKLIFIISILFSILTFSQNENKKIDKAKSVNNIIINCKTCGDCKTKKPLYILDGKIITEKSFRKVDPNTIKYLNVYKHKKATFLYGEKGKNGVIVIVSKTKKELKKEKRKANRLKKRQK